MIVPASCWVCALKALQNSMMLTPCWPRAGPTGGAGVAAPAWICSLMKPETFFFLGGITYGPSVVVWAHAVGDDPVAVCWVLARRGPRRLPLRSWRPG